MNKNIFNPERDKIIAASLQLISDGKFENASMGVIAYYARLSEMTLRMLYRSKDDIVKELAKYQTQRTGSREPVTEN